MNDNMRSKNITFDLCECKSCLGQLPLLGQSVWRLNVLVITSSQGIFFYAVAWASERFRSPQGHNRAQERVLELHVKLRFQFFTFRFLNRTREHWFFKF